ncbi:hypothetical protein CPB83DRAFT_855089 [Crepidotus variabilis]|uniref:Uncharacterized protein n=1 Tax=Crepidotus variabilis TaxID=179855 RepID=A0A9P6EF54_9AGAR|nr:hypothetical protein CPB83DRAFT_855089 [Crepidotus variabilis]
MPSPAYSMHPTREGQNILPIPTPSFQQVAYQQPRSQQFVPYYDQQGIYSDRPYTNDDEERI